jgi:hypothetical protein
MASFARRFRRGAALLAIVVSAAIVVAVVLGFVLLHTSDSSASIAAWTVAAALALVAVVQVFISRSRITALRQVICENPRGAVFLARRQPALVSDLASYVTEPEIYNLVSDSWVVASIDDRGMAAWSVGRNPRELLLMPWSEIGGVEQIRLESGRPGVAVDVKPFPTPLVVSVGYAAYGYLGAFESRGVDEVVATANALRPQ